MTALEKQQKKISVIIPVYNAEKYIRETLDSIIKQSYKNLEIILIDNGSKDRSPDIIQKYEAKYPEIHMIEGSGKGPGASRNRGLKLAKGDYIVFADADDYLPDKEIFCKYINLAEQTDADIVVSNYARLWKDKILPATKHQSFALCSPSAEEFRSQRLFFCLLSFILFFFNDTATTEIYTLSLHDALPISSDLFCGSFLCRR